ncbi:unnamed protein product [Tuber aestivum]|uniref:C2H2-type domain-containing protein n=1 Tax=Tuber aestivum TaxID=59557 RepID=A0A292Q0C5_9PEZI|nr:unnamed protein product [Tuber aestivum]
MSEDFTEAPINPEYSSANNNMGTHATQDRAPNSIYAAGDPSLEYPNLSFVSSSHTNSMHSFGCTFPWGPNSDIICTYCSPLPEASYDSEMPLYDESSAPESSRVSGVSPTAGNSQDANHIGGGHMSFASTQAPESYSELFAINTALGPRWGDYHIDPQQLIPADRMIIAEPSATTIETPKTTAEGSVNTTETRGIVLPVSVYKTATRFIKRRASTRTSDSKTSYGQLTSTRSASPSSPTSPSAGVTKSKKPHQCPVCRCEKIFGRSAELKRHMASVHRDQVPKEKRPVLLDCPHEGCGRVGENGFKRKDNLVQHLRGVHGDIIEKSGRKSTTPQPNLESGAANSDAESTATVADNDQFSQYQQPADGWYAGDIFENPIWPF